MKPRHRVKGGVRGDGEARLGFLKREELVQVVDAVRRPRSKPFVGHGAVFDAGPESGRRLTRGERLA